MWPADGYVLPDGVVFTDESDFSPGARLPAHSPTVWMACCKPPPAELRLHGQQKPSPSTDQRFGGRWGLQFRRVE